MKALKSAACHSSETVPRRGIKLIIRKLFFLLHAGPKQGIWTSQIYICTYITRRVKRALFDIRHPFGIRSPLLEVPGRVDLIIHSPLRSIRCMLGTKKNLASESSHEIVISVFCGPPPTAPSRQIYSGSYERKLSLLCLPANYAIPFFLFSVVVYFISRSSYVDHIDFDILTALTVWRGTCYLSTVANYSNFHP